MLNLKNLVNGLKEYKVSAFMNIPQNKYSIQTYLKNSFNMMTYEGQKRVVIVNPDDPKTVIKIGCSEDGIWDNACEYIMTSTLNSLANNRTPIGPEGYIITPDDLNLFIRTELVNNDPFLLKAERVETPDSLEEFKQWKDTVAKIKYSGRMVNDSLLWTEFLLTYQDPITKQCILKNDFDKGFKILNQISIHSDLGYESPLNKGVKRINGTLRGVFLDLGSCLPIINDNQRPRCPKCGQMHLNTTTGLLNYYHVEVSDYNSIEKGVDTIIKLKGFYICNNPSCTNYGKFVLEDFQNSHFVPVELIDMNVFNNFINDIRYNPKKYPSYTTLFYVYSHIVSAPIGMDKPTFYQWLQQNVDNQYLADSTIFNVVYENYIFKTIASLVNTAYVPQVQNPLTAMLLSQEYETSITNGQLTYSVFKNNFQQALAAYGITGQNIVCKISAIVYLSHLVNGLKKIPNNGNLTFYSLYDLDINNFLASLSNYQNVYGRDLQDLYNFLHL